MILLIPLIDVEKDSIFILLGSLRSILASLNTHGAILNGHLMNLFSGVFELHLASNVDGLSILQIILMLNLNILGSEDDILRLVIKVLKRLVNLMLRPLIARELLLYFIHRR